MRDPLDLFNSLSDTPVKDYPGGTRPRNRGTSLDTAPSEQLLLLTAAPYKDYTVKGEVKRCYTVGTVAKLMGRKVTTLRSWEYKGWLPKPKLRSRPPDGGNLPGTTPKGRRLYTSNQVEYLLEAHKRFNLEVPKKADWTGFIQHLKDYPTS